MKHIVDIIKNKNVILLKLYKENKKQLHKITNSKDYDLTSFYLKRESLIKDLGLINQSLGQAMKNLNISENEVKAFKEEVSDAFCIKEELSREILLQDLTILSFIDSIKPEIIKELSFPKASLG